METWHMTRGMLPVKCEMWHMTCNSWLGVNILSKFQIVAPTQPHPTLGDSFPYEPGDTVHFLGSKSRIGLGCIAEICGSR